MHGLRLGLRIYTRVGKSQCLVRIASGPGADGEQIRLGRVAVGEVMFHKESRDLDGFSIG